MVSLPVATRVSFGLALPPRRSGLRGHCLSSARAPASSCRVIGREGSAFPPPGSLSFGLGFGRMALPDAEFSRVVGETTPPPRTRCAISPLSVLGTCSPPALGALKSLFVAFRKLAVAYLGTAFSLRVSGRRLFPRLLQPGVVDGSQSRSFPWTGLHAAGTRGACALGAACPVGAAPVWGLPGAPRGWYSEASLWALLSMSPKQSRALGGTPGARGLGVFCAPSRAPSPGTGCKCRCGEALRPPPAFPPSSGGVPGLQLSGSPGLPLSSPVCPPAVPLPSCRWRPRPLPSPWTDRGLGSLAFWPLLLCVGQFSSLGPTSRVRSGVGSPDAPHRGGSSLPSAPRRCPPAARGSVPRRPHRRKVAPGCSVPSNQ